MVDFPDTGFAPSRRFGAVAPSDTLDLTTIPKALWVSVAGTVAAIGVDDTGSSGVPFGTLAAGTLIPIRARRVMATGTTATLVALY
jgi:hypothetical protein